MNIKFRKKPVEIEAVHFDEYGGGADFFNAMPQWLKDAYDEGKVFNVGKYGLGPKEVHIKTLEGEMTATRGDWIIRGVKGEIYPCKPDIFAATYDAVTP